MSGGWKKLGVAALLAASLAAGGARVYRNEQARVRAFAPPAGWELAPQSSYPRLLAAYVGEGGARLTLAGQKLAHEQSPVQLAEQSRPALEKQGFTKVRVSADGDRARIDADVDGGKRYMRQVYLTEGGWAYVVTVIAPTGSAARTNADFDEAVHSLLIGGAGDSTAPQP